MQTTALNTRHWQERLGKEFRKSLRRVGGQNDPGNPLKRSNLAQQLGMSSEGLQKFSQGCGAISVENLSQLCALLCDPEFTEACADFVCQACGGVIGECACEDNQ